MQFEIRLPGGGHGRTGATHQGAQLVDVKEGDPRSVDHLLEATHKGLHLAGDRCKGEAGEGRGKGVERR